MSLISIIKKKTNKTLFTTPSHGGKFYIFHKFYQWYKSDISEIDALMPEQALQNAEKKASSIYGTKYTKFLTNGSTSGIIAAVISSNCKKILVWKNAHPCHKNACALAGANVIEYELNYDDNLGVYKPLSASEIEKLITEHNPDGIIITSPTYEGFASDVKTISKNCKAKRVKLIVDEAHGALYPFSDNLPESAVKHADYTVQSLHKTAGGLNPTALLHSNDNDPTDGLGMVNTTSPSYPMLATIEANIRFLSSKRGKKAINELINNLRDLKIPRLNDDITKILLKSDNLTGYELSEKLFNECNIEDERTNNTSTLLLCGIGTSKAKLNKLKKALKKLNY